MLETRALVVDDDEATVDVLTRDLRRLVRRVDQETDGHRALALFTAHRHSVVVTDLMMPQISGLEVMRRIHLIEPRTQVIIVTGFASKETAIEALNLHAFGLLEKPILLPQLYRLVADAFARFQERSNDDSALEAEISALYQGVATLAKALEQSPDDPQLRDAYHQRLMQLRNAQMTEADLVSQTFREKLALKRGAGYSSIEAARRVLDRDKDSA